jgi:hypothetical protein
MVSSGLLRRVALVRIDVSEEPGASVIRVTKIGALGTTQAATSNRRTLRRNTAPIFVTLMKEAPGSSETSVRTRATRRNNPEDTILQWKMWSSGIWRLVGILRIYVSEGHIASSFRMTDSESPWFAARMYLRELRISPSEAGGGMRLRNVDS